MKRTYVVILIAAAVISLVAAPQKDATAAAQLQAAINKQTVEGDLNGAIKQYAAIAAKYAKTDRSIAASALVRMAECHQAMGDAEARAIYERIVRDYADQREAVDKARAGLLTGRTAPGGVSVREVWACSSDPYYCGQRISPDGRYLAFTYSALHNALGGDVAVRDLATGENRLLTHHAPTTQTDNEVWSPDGKRLAYNWADYKEVRIINTDGSGERTVSRAQNDESVVPADWSPDGKRILINRGTKNNPSRQLEWLDVAGGTATPIKTLVGGGNARVSPDGRYITFTAREAAEKAQQVHLIASDGSGETVLSAHPAGEYPAGWSPDGRHVIFISLRGGAPGLWEIPVANGKAEGPARVLKTVLSDDNSVTSLGVTRDGALYFTSNVFASDIYTASLDATTGKANSSPILLPLSRTGHNMAPIWSPDGHRLLTSWVEPLAGTTNAFREMTILALDTGKEVRLPVFESGLGRCWSPDGKAVLAGPPLTRIDLATGAKKAIEGAPGSPSCYPKGSLVAYGEYPSKFVAVRDLETGSEKELYRASGNVHAVWSTAISPDGSQVAFIISESPNPNAYGSSAVMLVSAAGGPVRELVRATAPSRVSEPGVLTWSPDSRYVYFVKRPSRFGIGELLRVPAAGGQPESADIKMAGMRDLSISPDGTRIAFSTAGARSWQVSAIENFLPAAK